VSFHQKLGNGDFLLKVEGVEGFERSIICSMGKYFYSLNECRDFKINEVCGI
jgi:hypothetical protein